MLYGLGFIKGNIMINLNKIKALVKYYIWNVGCSYLVVFPLFVISVLIINFKDYIKAIVWDIKDGIQSQNRINKSTLNGIKGKYE